MARENLRKPDMQVRVYIHQTLLGEWASWELRTQVSERKGSRGLCQLYEQLRSGVWAASTFNAQRSALSSGKSASIFAPERGTYGGASVGAGS